MAPIHQQVLAAAVALSGPETEWRFRLLDVVRALPTLNEGSVRTHVTSRCCVNAPAHHQSRHPYFRALGNGVYAIEPPFRRRSAPGGRARGWQDAVIARIDSGVDATQIGATLALTPTERLQRMQRTAQSLERMRG